MLTDLTIKNFAIIDQLHAQFGNGLNALTGETGAGKSILKTLVFRTQRPPRVDRRKETELLQPNAPSTREGRF